LVAENSAARPQIIPRHVEGRGDSCSHRNLAGSNGTLKWKQGTSRTKTGQRVEKSQAGLTWKCCRRHEVKLSAFNLAPGAQKKAGGATNGEVSFVMLTTRRASEERLVACCFFGNAQNGGSVEVGKKTGHHYGRLGLSQTSPPHSFTTAGFVRRLIFLAR